ncbi:MAG TPA: hypothetical protein VGI81_06080 [Tepidisphaeraceae bacterium]|jgi:hypothetical protein
MDGYLLDLQSLDPFQKWTLICAAGLTVIYVVMRPFKKKRKDPLVRPGGALSLAGQREVERQMTELLVELEQMARQMTAQIDTRAAKLDLLIKEADEKIALLRKLAHGATPARLSTDPTVPSDGASPQTDVAPGLAPAIDPRHAQVYELADAGLSARQIAQQLGRPNGEVELILAIRPREVSAGVNESEHPQLSNQS